MLNKLIIGTANFVKPYGVFARGVTVEKKEVHAILKEALESSITTLDTAVAYGNLVPIIPENLASRFNVVTKVSALDEKANVINNLECFKSFSKIEGVLIHDPQNIKLTCKKKLRDRLHYLKEVQGISKIGVSVYDMTELDIFSDVMIPDIVQVPLNPFNQSFDNPVFKAFVKTHDIEVHARSLFLQGILLSDNLPPFLEPIKSFWLNFQEHVKSYPSRLHALLSWGFDHDWVKNWVIGVSSYLNFEQIVQSVPGKKTHSKLSFQVPDHPLVDPRNWGSNHA